MAIFVFKMETFSRNAGSRGRSAISAAAYRAGERIRDERTGSVYDHQRRRDVLHKQIILPAAHAGRERTLQWAATRSALWNAAERAETRRNSRVAREFTLALPHELAPAARLQLAQRYAHDLSDRYGTAIDLALHAPRGDPRNFHAHLLMTTREVTAQGPGPKAALELSGSERHRRGLARWAQEKAWLRERWAQHTNQALLEAHLQVRVSHLRAATPDLRRAPWLPIAAYYMERQGRHSFVAERIRARHHARAALAALTPAPSTSAPTVPAPSAAGARRWLDQLRERARTAWLSLRAHSPTAPVAVRPPQRANPSARAALPEPRPASPGGADRSGVPTVHSTYVPTHSAVNSFDWLNEVARQSARNWLAYRQRQLEAGQEHERSPQRARSHDYDLGL